jgi:hypothetical protein
VLGKLCLTADVAADSIIGRVKVRSQAKEKLCAIDNHVLSLISRLMLFQRM